MKNNIYINVATNAIIKESSTIEITSIFSDKKNKNIIVDNDNVKKEKIELDGTMSNESKNGSDISGSIMQNAQKTTDQEEIKMLFDKECKDESQGEIFVSGVSEAKKSISYAESLSKTININKEKIEIDL